MKKTEILVENPIALSPVNFFQIQLDCKKLEGELSPRKAASYRLPSLHKLCGDQQFAEVAMGWNLEKLEFLIEIDQPYKSSSYPAVQRGDSVELFLDARDVKTSGFCTRFCHHFFFLPESYEGIAAGELTRFLTEDRHDPCDPVFLQVKPTFRVDSYLLRIAIGAQALTGYDPEQFDRLGFAYRINRVGGGPQHFSATSDDFPIEQQPSLWSSLKLIS